MRQSRKQGRRTPTGWSRSAKPRAICAGPRRAPPRPEADSPAVCGRIGERPTALGHHHRKWLHVAAFVQPTSGAPSEFTALCFCLG